jgi:hypothetical protein
LASFSLFMVMIRSIMENQIIIHEGKSNKQIDETNGDSTL